MYLAPENFAATMGIGVRAAQIAFQKAAEGKRWKGFDLPVVALPGNRGGAGGKVWALAVDRCPAELKAKLGAVEGPFEAPFQRPLKAAPVAGWQWDEQADRARIIQPILATEKGTAERAEAFRKVAAQEHFIRDTRKSVSENTLRDWVRAHEAKGLTGVMPAARAGKGKARVLITREWDSGIDLPLDVRGRIAERVARVARSMVFNDGTSVREALRLAGDELCRLSLETGSRLPVAMVRGLCQLNTKCAERIDLDRYRAGYLARKDHKRYQDKAVGRVNLALADTPMSLLQGDVHYADIAVAEGAEPVRVRLIAWLDMSSLFLWVTPVLLSKGQGIVQADVAESLAHVTMCDHGGIPEHFYLDNGSEYSALSEAMARLAVLSDQAFGLTLAKPYSPTSKGSIEGLFNIVEQVFKGLPGWIGTVAVSREDIEDDRIGVFKPAFAEMGGMARRHPDELVFSLLKNGFSSPCYDGQFFFDTDHPVIGEDGTTVTTVANTDGGSGAPWFLLDVSRAVRPIIWQERVSYEFQQMTKNDDDEVFFNDRYVYGVRARVNAGFGLWQLAWGSKQTLDGASYGAARAAMQGFRADGGRILGVRPSVLVVAPALESAALKIVNSEFGPGGETNEWKGTASVIVAPWLA